MFLANMKTPHSPLQNNIYALCWKKHYTIEFLAKVLSNEDANAILKESKFANAIERICEIIAKAIDKLKEFISAVVDKIITKVSGVKIKEEIRMAETAIERRAQANKGAAVTKQDASPNIQNHLALPGYKPITIKWRDDITKSSIESARNSITEIDVSKFYRVFRKDRSDLLNSVSITRLITPKASKETPDTFVSDELAAYTIGKEFFNDNATYVHVYGSPKLLS